MSDTRRNKGRAKGVEATHCSRKAPLEHTEATGKDSQSISTSQCSVKAETKVKDEGQPLGKTKSETKSPSVSAAACRTNALSNDEVQLSSQDRVMMLTVLCSLMSGVSLDTKAWQALCLSLATKLGDNVVDVNALVQERSMPNDSHPVMSTKLGYGHADSKATWDGIADNGGWIDQTACSADAFTLEPDPEPPSDVPRLPCGPAHVQSHRPKHDGKGVLYNACVARPVRPAEVKTNEKAQEAMQKEWDRLRSVTRPDGTKGVWDEDKVSI